MYCTFCGTPLAKGLSFCNRCGASLKERGGQGGAISAFLAAITLIGLIGLGIMLGGAYTLRREAQLGEDVVALFMFLAFFIITTIEILLVRQLSRLISSGERKEFLLPPQQSIPAELRTAPAHALPEPIPSVTENTTRTLAYSRKEPAR